MPMTMTAMVAVALPVFGRNRIGMIPIISMLMIFKTQVLKPRLMHRVYICQASC